MALVPLLNSPQRPEGLRDFSPGLSLFIVKSFWSNRHEAPRREPLCVPMGTQVVSGELAVGRHRPEFKPGFRSTFLPGAGLWELLCP